MISSLIDEVIDQLGQDKDSMTEEMVLVVEDTMEGNEKAHEEVSDYLKARSRDERVASMQAEFKRLFPGFDKEILEWGGGGRRKKTSGSLAPRRSSRGLRKDSMERGELDVENDVGDGQSVAEEIDDWG